MFYSCPRSAEAFLVLVFSVCDDFGIKKKGI